MLHDFVQQFLNYCKNADFAERSIEALVNRLNELSRFAQTLGTQDVADITYQHLLSFVSDFQSPSLHVKKSRVWVLHQFYHFLVLQNVISDNPASFIPYPKIGRKVPQFLTIDEFNRLLGHFAKDAHSFIGLRNLIIVMLFGFLGLRLLAVTKLNIEDVDVNDASIWVQEKGGIKRRLYLPQVLCKALTTYLTMRDATDGALLITKRKNRISDSTVQNLLKTLMVELGISKHLHAHLFRHTAATHLNKTAGPDITRFVLGHAMSYSTERYIHLNPDIYADYMKRHPYMNHEWS